MFVTGDIKREESRLK